MNIILIILDYTILSTTLDDKTMFIDKPIADTQLLDHQDVNILPLTEKEFSEQYYRHLWKVGWKPIVDAMAAYYALANGLIYGLKYRHQLIGTIAAVKTPGYGIAYIGFFIIDKKWRGKAVSNWLIKTLKLKLDGYRFEFEAPNKLIPYYSKKGYKIITTTTTYSLKNLNKIKSICYEKNPCIQDIDDRHLAAIIDYDFSIVPDSNRASFLYKWFNKQKTYAACYVMDGNVQGYGVISQFMQPDGTIDGYYIAPVFAKNSEIATCLILSLCHQVGFDQAISLDALDYYPEPAKVMEALGFEAIARSSRFSLSGKLEGKNRLASAAHVFALSSYTFSPF